MVLITDINNDLSCQLKLNAFELNFLQIILQNVVYNFVAYIDIVIINYFYNLQLDDI